MSLPISMPRSLAVLRMAISPKAPTEVVATDLPRKPSKVVNAFLTEQDQRAAIDAGGDVNQIRARHVGVNRRRAALVNVHLCRRGALARTPWRSAAEIDGNAALAEIAGFVGQKQR